MDEFFQVLHSYKRLGAMAASGAAAATLAAYAFGISPPWPKGIMLVTALAELICLAISFQLYQTAPKAKVNRIMIAWLVPLIFSFALYISIFSFFTYTTPHTGERFAAGFVCSKSIYNVDPLLCPENNPDALKDSQYSAEQIWTPWSVKTVQLALVALWLSSFCSLAMLLGAFISFQGNRRRSRNVKR